MNGVKGSCDYDMGVMFDTHAMNFERELNDEFYGNVVYNTPK